MKPVVSALQMKNAENALFATGVSSLSVMERAAHALVDELIALLGDVGKTCVFACGSGGNGGDGYAAARLFAKRGGRAIVVSVYPPKTADAITNYERAKECVFALTDVSKIDTLPVPDAWVDAVFGIGVTRPLDDAALSIVRRMNADRDMGALVVSCDIPSGLCADTGNVYNECVNSDLTVCFQALKLGHLLGSGMDVCGKTVVRDIGISSSFFEDNIIELTESSFIKDWYPRRRRTAHKNNFGHLLLVAGSFGMAGAAALAASAALRSGCGLVSIACPESIVPILQTLCPCAMCIPLAEADGAISKDSLDTLLHALSGKTAVAIGPGLSRKCAPSVIESILKCSLPAVFDADALNIISANPDLLSLLRPHHAITPHPGEAKRLINGDYADAISLTNALSAFHCQVLLKGSSSVISGDDGTFISASGTSGMAKGGSGDALTGITGALLALGVKPLTALLMASEIHGIAGEIAAGKHGDISMLPTDLIAALGEAFSLAFNG